MLEELTDLRHKAEGHEHKFAVLQDENSKLRLEKERGVAAGRGSCDPAPLSRLFQRRCAAKAGVSRNCCNQKRHVDRNKVSNDFSILSSKLRQEKAAGLLANSCTIGSSASAVLGYVCYSINNNNNI